MVIFGDVVKLNFATSRIELYGVPDYNSLCPKLNFILSQTMKEVMGCRELQERKAVQIFIM